MRSIVSALVILVSTFTSSALGQGPPVPAAVVKAQALIATKDYAGAIVILEELTDGKELLTLTGESHGHGFGIGVSDAGDVDGDGHADLIVGAWQHSSGATSAGKIYLHSGKTGALIKAYTCRIAGDTFGFDTTNLGDVDGDGTIDFLVTSAWSGVNGFQSGRVFVISSGIRAAKSAFTRRKR